jgi:hypothetical protein
MTPASKKAQEAMEASARARLAAVISARAARAEAAASALAGLPSDHWVTDEELTELIEWLLAESGRGPHSAGVHVHRVGALLAEILHKRRSATELKEHP